MHAPHAWASVLDGIAAPAWPAGPMHGPMQCASHAWAGGMQLYHTPTRAHACHASLRRAVQLPPFALCDPPATHRSRSPTHRRRHVAAAPRAARRARPGRRRLRPPARPWAAGQRAHVCAVLHALRAPHGRPRRHGLRGRAPHGRVRAAGRSRGRRAAGRAAGAGGRGGGAARGVRRRHVQALHRQPAPRLHRAGARPRAGARGLLGAASVLLVCTCGQPSHTSL